MERWFSLELNKIPRTWTKKQWKDASRWIRTVESELHKYIDKEALDKEISKTTCDLAIFGVSLTTHPDNGYGVVN